MCRTEAFDVTPYAKAVAYYLLGHPDTQDFGRKFKFAFSGCEHEACGLVNMHDMGLLALMQNGKRGFRAYVGGGLGPVPYQAKVFIDFLPEEELLPISQAVARVFARLGEKQNRARARIKFLVAKLGVEEFRRLVDEERKILPHDPRWTAFIPEAHGFKETPLKSGASLNGAAKPEGYVRFVGGDECLPASSLCCPWYAVVTISLPIGDFTSRQARCVADLARKHQQGQYPHDRGAESGVPLGGGEGFDGIVSAS